jgi:hypothetical protein
VAIPNTPDQFLVQTGNGNVFLSWRSVVGATSGSTGSPAGSTGYYDIQRSTDGLNFGRIATINTPYFYDASSAANGPSTGIIYWYQVAANGGSGQSSFTTPIATTVTNFGQTTLGAVRLAAQQRADMVNNGFVSTQEWNDYINHSYYELYDILIQTYGDEYYVATPYSFSTDSRNPALYNLPNNFYKLLGVDLAISPNGSGTTNGWLTLKKHAFISRNRYIYGNTPVSFLGILQLRYRLVGGQIEFVPIPSSNQTVRLWYIPRPITLLSDSDVLDGISGWDEYVIVDSAIKALQKEESDCSLLMAQKGALLKRIEAAASNRDAGEPEVATDVRRLDGGYFSDPGGDGPSGGW